MQPNLVNFLMGTPPTAAAHAKPGEDNGASFAQLLGDADAQSGGQSKGGSCNQPPAVALIAQELDPTQLAALQGAQGDKLAQLLTQMIGPEQARDLIARLEALANSGQGHDHHQAFDQLKEALEQIEITGESTDVAGLLENLPAVAEAETPAERASVLQRMLGWVQSAFDKQKEASQQAAAASLMPDAAVQSLQASLFSAGDDATTSAPSQTDEDQTDGQTFIQIIPLSHGQVSALPEWVHKLTEGEENIAPAAIDEAIPALTLAQDDSLPDVTLPDGAALKAKQAQLTPAQSFRDQLAALSVHDEQPVSEQVNTTPAVLAMAPITTHHATTITPLSHAGLGHYTPHLAATEQVQMAMTTAAKDGIDRITLQLEPADLGRVEIKMEMTGDGRTNISFLVDKPDTLDALSRDARSLERSLQEAGIRADAGTMQFNLRQQQEQPEFNDEQGGRGHAADDLDKEAALGGITSHYTINVREGVDIHA